MRLSVLVHTRPDGLFELRTSNGNKVGDRLVSSAPEHGRKLPPEKTVYEDKVEASMAAAEWIVYLTSVRNRKTKQRR